MSKRIILSFFVFLIAIAATYQPNQPFQPQRTIVQTRARVLNTTYPCRSFQTELGVVCVCTDDYCDSLDARESEYPDEFLFVTSSSAGDRFSYNYGHILPASYNRYFGSGAETFLGIDSSITYQKVVGFGGAFSGSVSYIADNMTPRMQECLYRSFYSYDDGMGLTFCRIPIGGSDFDLESWAYVEDSPNDTQLSNFTELDQRDVKRNEQIDEMIRISENNDIKFLATAWSAPRWMKTEFRWSGENGNYLLPQYYQTWADYHLRWLQLMQQSGKSISAISTGNEPLMSEVLIFESMPWNVTEQANWLVNYLAPTIKNSNFSNVEIHALEDGRHRLLPYINDFLRYSKDALDSVSSFNIHGYADEDSDPAILEQVQRIFPDKTILYTEMSFGLGDLTLNSGPQLGLWSRAERQSRIMITNFNNFMNGYMDWNIVLNPIGGPNTVENYIDAPIITNADFSVMYKQPLFYALAHFSKYIPRGSVRIYWRLRGPTSLVSSIETTAFLRPDQKIVVILLNQSATQEIRINIEDSIKGTMVVSLKPKSINTLVYSLH